MHRDPDPVGPIIQLIPEFIDRLLEHEGVEQNLQLVTIRGNERGALRRIEVSLEERPRTPYLPKPRPRLHRGEVALAQGSTARVLQQRRESRVMKRAQHPGNVANGSALAPAVTQRARRLTFEIDNHEILAGIEHLPEVQIAMRANTQSGHLALEKIVEARGDTLRMSHQTIERLSAIFGNKGLPVT